MRTHFIAIIVSFVTIIFPSCNQQRGKVREVRVILPDRHIMVQTLDENATVLKEKVWGKDSAGNWIEDGYHKEFYFDGKIKLLAFYKKGVQDSIAYQYFKNGKVQWRTFWRHGRKYGPQYRYYETGTVMEVVLFKKDSTMLFIGSFDTEGKVRTLNGNPLRVLPNKTVLSRGDTIGIVNEIVPLPSIKTALKIQLFLNNRKLSDTSVESFGSLSSFNNHFFPFFFSPKNSGHYEYEAQVLLIDSLTNQLLKIDSSRFDFNVR